MSSVKLNDSHDLEIVNNDLFIVEGADEVKQKLLQKFKMFYKEWFLDVSQGIPYIEEVFLKQPNTFRVDAILKQTIVSTEGVLELLEYDLDFNNSTRALKLKFLVKTNSGEVSFNEVLP